MTRYLVLFLAAIVVLGGVATAQEKGNDQDNKEKAELYVKEGLKQLKAGKAQMAVQCFMKALQYDPKNVTALLAMADLARLRRLAPGQIIKAYREVLKVVKDHQAANYYIAEQYIKMKRFDAALPFIEKAAKSKKGLVTLPGSDQPDPMIETVIQTYYGQVLSELGKTEKALEILEPLAAQNKFDAFASHPDKALQHWAWMGYLIVGYSLSDLKKFAQADQYLSRVMNIQKQLYGENKIHPLFDQKMYARRYSLNKMRVPCYGTAQKDRFLNEQFKVVLTKPSKKWDFYFVTPEQYRGNEAYYKQRRQFHVGGIILIEKNSNGEYSIACQVDIEGVDPNRINYSSGGERVNLNSPESANEIFLKNAMERYVDIKDRRFIPKTKFNREFTASYFQFTGSNKEHPEIKRDVAKWVVRTRVYVFFIDITGPGGSRKENWRDIQNFLRRIKISF